MEKLAGVVSAMNRLELQMTKDVDTVRRGLFDTQTEQQEPLQSLLSTEDTAPLPARIVQIRESRRRLEVPEAAAGRGLTTDTEDF